MKIIKSKTKYCAEDGTEFSSKELAKGHEKFVEAKHAYDYARNTLGKMLAKSCITADGKEFRIDLWHEYFWITPGYFSMPSILTVEFWGNNWDWRYVNESQKEIVLISRKDDFGKIIDNSREFKIEELYFDKNAVHAAIKDVQRKWLNEKLKELQTRTA
jgi:hypothetical protein